MAQAEEKGNGKDKLIKNLKEQAQIFRKDGDHLSAHYAERVIAEIGPAAQAEKVVQAGTACVNGIRTLINGNPSGIDVAMSVSQLAGGMLQALPGAYGPLAGAVLSLVGACFGFGLGGQNIAKQIQEMMTAMLEELKDFMHEQKDDSITEVFNAQIMKNDVLVCSLEALITPEDMSNMNNEQIVAFLQKNDDPIKLSQAQFNELTDMEFKMFGIKMKGILKTQLEKYRGHGNEKKQNYLARYVYYYVQVVIWRRYILSLQGLLLKINGENKIYNGIQNIIKNDEKNDIKFVQDFVKWRKENRLIHRSFVLCDGISQDQVHLIDKYLKQNGERLPLTYGLTWKKKPGVTIALKGCYGRYLCAQNGDIDSNWKVVCNRPKRGSWETWTSVPVGEKIFLSSDHDRYLAVNERGEVQNWSGIAKQSYFIVVDCNNGKYAFQNKESGNYLSARKDGNIECKKSDRGREAQFTVEWSPWIDWD